MTGPRNGGFCAKPDAYWRWGYPWEVGDTPFSLSGAWGRCSRDHALGCEQDGAIIYPKCAHNYHAVGCCICSPNCPGMFDIGVSCLKGLEGRGVGVPMSCAPGRQQIGALCYGECNPGWTKKDDRCVENIETCEPWCGPCPGLREGKECSPDECERIGKRCNEGCPPPELETFCFKYTPQTPGLCSVIETFADTEQHAKELLECNGYSSVESIDCTKKQTACMCDGKYYDGNCECVNNKCFQCQAGKMVESTCCGGSCGTP